MTGLDEAKVKLRRRAIAEAWPTTRVVIAEDIAETAREDGTRALRTIEDQAARLGIGTATVQRHRRELVKDGVFTVRRMGGNGRGATLLDLESSGSPDDSIVITHPETSSGSPAGATVISDSGSRGSEGDQSLITVERERDQRPLASSPTSSSSDEKRSGKGSSEPADQLAAATGWPLDHCRQALATKHAELVARKAVRHPDALLASIVKGDPHSLGAPVQVRRTAAQCDDRDPHGRHDWEDVRNRHWCHGVEEWDMAPA